MKRLRKCLLCHKKLGLVKFKTADGYICKYCYRISSLDYTKTVTSMTLADLKQVVQQAPQEKMITDSANFMITRRMFYLMINMNSYVYLTIDAFLPST